MKIAIINNTAVRGSTGKLAHTQFETLLRDGHDVRFYYGRYDRIRTDRIRRINSIAEEWVHIILARVTGLNGYFSIFATKRLIWELEAWGPDLVQIYNMHGYHVNYHMILRFLGKSGVPVVWSMIDEFPYMGRCCYPYDCDKYKTGCRHCKADRHIYPKTWFFRYSAKMYKDKEKTYGMLKKACFVAPQYVVDRARESGLLKGREFYAVDEYVDTDAVFRPIEQYQHIEKELLASRCRIVVTVAAYSDRRKGGRYFIELARMCEACEDLLFVYIGMDEDIQLPKNCVTRTYINDQNELAEYYVAADVYVCTSLSDTMPNVCLDALACGTPVIGFDNTGIPYVAESPLGIFVESGNVEALVAEVKKVQKKTPKIVKACRDYAVSRYSPGVYYEKMKEIYRHMSDIQSERN